MALDSLNEEKADPQWSSLQQKFPSNNGNEYREEIPDRLWSLWGSPLYDSEPKTETDCPLPNSATVPPGRLLARCVVACCVSNIVSLDEWNSQLLDRIMLYGSQYHDISCSALQRDKGEAELSLENLYTACILDKCAFWVYTEKVLCGKLYSKRKSLGSALSAFFNQHQRTGIVQLKDRTLAFGFMPECSSRGAYFMFNCQGKDHGTQGAPYLLRMRQLQKLLHCLLVALNERGRNVDFKIYKVWCVPRS
ncbi:uncharacterized protein Dwil_GK19066 [Drosophila willistoni]|uniref:Uncharacterized protein n=1 Tax=Drosophila willistoni TaxID=7260 RepID=B4MV60_DROWI|nr:uncharacterized protein LOC6642381 [Drosophila willistoni]EDW76405.1 uncharacterized protein Dwil_GK19066 [Drosophila willistoni]